ncbi:MAG: hypothetical protein MZV63_39490 [Marinilabiliales bacterium]|nr:hypothetical protein [Marinilabiliales bacterium]
MCTVTIIFPRGLPFTARSKASAARSRGECVFYEWFEFARSIQLLQLLPVLRAPAHVCRCQPFAMDQPGKIVLTGRVGE